MKKSVVTLLFVMVGLLAYAQPAPPSNPVPLDAGISLLIAAGAAYGAKKVHDLRKRD